MKQPLYQPREGDRVKIRECSVLARGVIVAEISDDFVSVQWEDLPVPVTYRRTSLECLPEERSATE